jgi:argininosuccinate lyase
MWGGHFTHGPAEAMAAINPSIGFDWQLYRQDIAGSKAHATMLGEQKILSTEDVTAIHQGLDEILAEIEQGSFVFSDALEDIHMNIEARLREKIGDAAARLHTARSRNDQVATDIRLFLRDSVDGLRAEIFQLIRALLARAEEHAETILPGFTHLQTAQPVTLGHHLMAYVEMLGRDADRLLGARQRINQCPLGAAALAGTSYPIQRERTASLLGFDAPMANSLDAVSARDAALEYLADIAILATHLSRLAEEFVVWSSAPFGFIRLSDHFTTGSSIMPQKRNPDAAELIRGKSGRFAGAFISLLTTMKSLPLAYSKDMQEDKEPLFDAARQMPLCLAAMRGMVQDMEVRAKAMHQAAAGGYSTATDLADWLVQKLNMPFRDAHHITGRIVKLAEAKACRLDELSLAEMQSVEPRMDASIFDRLTVEASVASRTSLGGTAPLRVREQISAWQARIADENPA